ncbi:FISUMP domain-containing protein [Flavobacterium aciduliphilum]|uniref:Uncharacterized protein (TIGR02145 family) n=1 Tax=Flavobacterium aciduliphilum TaxID=1101402 RepID=A0A328YHZ9_9FLAO|nr:FISUMP domain-containing protein [Flavobacterium aciduliphilum]RAR73718.1 uncharacterized protein (TIGR02145 family) [Flavobacterium aciduliphilum]
MNKIEQIKELKSLFDSGVLDSIQYTKLLNEIIDQTENKTSFETNSSIEDRNYQSQSVEKIEDYKSVKIGNQEWMTENLNSKTFRNGDVIQEASDSLDWIEAIKSKTPAWCYYEDDPIHAEKKGLLYNFYAVHDPRGLAPSGWQVPTVEDFNYLLQNTDYRSLKSREDWYFNEEVLIEGDSNEEVDIIKKIGLLHYHYKININPGENGTNKSGFNLKPSGYFDIRENNGSFHDVDIASVLWIYNNKNKFICAHNLYPFRAPYIDDKFMLIKNYSWKEFSLNNESGFAVRCIKKDENLNLLDYSNIQINRDILFNQASEIIIDAKYASASLLQRKLKIGYDRAKILMNQLESAGIVEPESESKSRKVLIDNVSKLFEVDNGSLASTSVNNSNKGSYISENAIEVKLTDNGLKITNWLKSEGQQITFLDSLFNYEISQMYTEESSELCMCDILSISEMDDFTMFKGTLTNIYVKEGEDYIPNSIICVIEPDVTALEEYKLLKK